MKNKIRFTVDSRDYHAHQHFGQMIPTFEKAVSFDDPNIPEKVQPPGNVQCTCYTTTYIAQNKTKKEYDIDELFSRIPHSTQGADPRDVLKEVIKTGFRIKGTNDYDKPFSSYWRADTGAFDPFDNVRSSMLTVQSPIFIGTFWYREWLDLGANAVMPIGKTPLSGHAYADKGWFGLATPTNVNGEPMFIIEWWGGYTMYMPRATFNSAMKPTGMQCWVLSTAEIDVKRQKTLIETIKDLMTNLIIALRDKIKLYKVEPVVPAPDIVPVAPQPPTQPITPSRYDWDTPTLARHSVRVICDEEGLTVEQKDTMCATIGAESGWKTSAVNYNKKNGKVVSTDYGICQWNDYYHGKEISPDEAVNNPEKAVRLMCAYWKRGQRDLWSAYKNGSYKKYL